MDLPLPKGAKPVVGFPDYYATPDGRILTSQRGGLEPVATEAHPRSGHLRVDLWKDGRRHHKYVATLVAEAFHGVRPDGDNIEVLHGDSDVNNNRPENLQWGTRSQNAVQREDEK